MTPNSDATATGSPRMTRDGTTMDNSNSPNMSRDNMNNSSDAASRRAARRDRN